MLLLDSSKIQMSFPRHTGPCLDPGPLPTQHDRERGEATMPFEVIPRSWNVDKMERLPSISDGVIC